MAAISSGRNMGSFAQYMTGIGVPIRNTSGNILRGGGIKGLMPRGGTHERSSSFAQNRQYITRGLNTSASSGTSYPRRAIGSFWAAMNAGDILSREYYACGVSTSGYSSRPGVHGIKGRFGGHASCRGLSDPNAPPAAACNPKFVYDSSDYIRYKKQKARIRNYNDISVGGGNKADGTSALRRLRH